MDPFFLSNAFQHRDLGYQNSTGIRVTTFEQQRSNFGLLGEASINPKLCQNVILQESPTALLLLGKLTLNSSRPLKS